MILPWDLIFKIGSLLIGLFGKNLAKKEEMTNNFKAWILEIQVRSSMSVDARTSYQKQLDELRKK